MGSPRYILFHSVEGRSVRDSPLLELFGCRYIGWERWLPYEIVIIGSSWDGPPIL